jgi:hypothetical protein
MPVQPIVSVDDVAVRKKLQKLSEKSGVAIGFIAEDQLRLWATDMMKKTAPKKLKDGLFTVAKGIAELFVPLDNAAALTHWLDALQQSGTDIYRTTKTGKVSKMKISQKQLKAATLNNARAFHKAHRTKKGGVKLDKRDKKSAWGGKMLMPRAVYKRFERDTQKHVGFLKAGWVPSVRYYSGRTNKSTNIPAWIRRHSKKVGYVAGKIDKDGNGFVAAINNVAYANRRISQDNLIGLTQETRQKDLTRGGFKRMDDLVKRFNAGQI